MQELSQKPMDTQKKQVALNFVGRPVLRGDCYLGRACLLRDKQEYCDAIKSHYENLRVKNT